MVLASRRPNRAGSWVIGRISLGNYDSQLARRQACAATPSRLQRGITVFRDDDLDHPGFL
jgi:hypothetical protein